MTASVQLNQVNLDPVIALVGAINANPAKAQTVWASQVNWTGAFTSESSSRDFAAEPSDEPITLGGTNTAPNPVEQLLGALGNCLAVGYVANATLAGIELDSLTIQLDGDLDLRVFLGLADGHAGFSQIRASVDLRSHAEPENIADLHAKVAATSPVGHTLKNAVSLNITAA